LNKFDIKLIGEGEFRVKAVFSDSQKECTVTPYGSNAGNVVATAETNVCGDIMNAVVRFFVMQKDVNGNSMMHTYIHTT